MYGFVQSILNVNAMLTSPLAGSNVNATSALALLGIQTPNSKHNGWILVSAAGGIGRGSVGLWSMVEDGCDQGMAAPSFAL